MSCFDLDSIEELVARQEPFALYRLPEGRESVFFGGGTLEVIHDIEELNGRRGFVMAPFRADETHPVVLVAAGEGAEPQKVAVEPSHEEQKDDWGNVFYEPCSEDYAAHYQVFQDALQRGDYSKLVLSRTVETDKPHDFSLAKLYRRALKMYPRSCVYLCYTPRTGLWFGASSEVILSGEENRWQVVALAGTQPVLWDVLPEKWDAKNRREQALVVNYLREVLESMGIRASEHGPKTVQAGALAHLKTEFDFALEDHAHLGRLLKRLHPTPAVCGLPKEKAFGFIAENEGYDRSYYSGFMGWIDPEHRSDLYVNLRCMEILADHLRLYAGGGLLATSVRESEWRETENKLQTMKRIIGHEDDSDN